MNGRNDSVAGLLAATVRSDHFQPTLVVGAKASATDDGGTKLPGHTERRPNDPGVPLPVAS